MASFVLAYNTHPGPLVVSADGRMLGGHEWGVVDSEDPAVKYLTGILTNNMVTGNVLVVVDPLPVADEGTDPDVAAVIAQVNELNGSAPTPADAAEPAPAPAAEEPALAPADADVVPAPAPAHRSRKAAQ